MRYDRLEKIATLQFMERDAVIFNLESIKLKYEFENQNIPDNEVGCISNSIYKFSTEAIERHVFHDKYLCEIVVVCSGGKSFNMEFLFFIPYFEEKTAFKIGTIDTFFPPDDIINIFNNEFIADDNLTSHEQSLLCDLQ